MRAGRTIGFLLALVGVLLAGCMNPRPLPAPAGVTLTPLRTISTLEGRVMLAAAGVKGLPVRHAVDCYRMEYPGLDAKGRAIRLTGLLALPRGVPPRRLASFQHGTATTRSAVPSKPDGTGLAAAVLFGGAGYAVVAPDYPGMGGSPGRHPYYVTEAIAPAVVGMIEAAQRIEGVPKNAVFLSGFSEGGWASVAALRLLEAKGVKVLAAAPVAGPYDIRRISLPAAMKGGAPSHSLYLAYLAWGQAAHHGRRLDSALTPHYAAEVERLFSGATPKEILAALPADPRRMFNAAYLDAFDSGGPHWLLDALQSARVIDTTPRAPMRLYYGSADTDVVPEEARAAERAMRARGADVKAVDVGPVGHDASMLAAAPAIMAWLNALEAAEQARTASAPR
jgi:pimeloyl-ACP methyl ester carboxylesterase